MIEYEEYKLNTVDLQTKLWPEVVAAVYAAIPAHELHDIGRDEITQLLGYYPKLYSILSEQWSYILEHYESRVDGRTKDIKSMLEQAMKVVKFQYEALSRKITFEKEEAGITFGANAK